MLSITKIIFTIFLLSLTAGTLSAHQEHFSKNEIFESSNVSVVATKSPISEDPEDNNCELNNLNESGCFCCNNGICLSYDQSSCLNNNSEHLVSCMQHCEDAGSENNSIIIQNFKSFYVYKITLSNISTPTNNTITNAIITSKKTITKNTPTYISIQSFLI